MFVVPRTPRTLVSMILAVSMLIVNPLDVHVQFAYVYPDTLEILTFGVLRTILITMIPTILTIPPISIIRFQLIIIAILTLVDPMLIVKMTTIGQFVDVVMDMKVIL